MNKMRESDYPALRKEEFRQKLGVHLTNDSRSPGFNLNNRGVCVVAVPTCLRGTDELTTRSERGMKKRGPAISYRLKKRGSVGPLYKISHSGIKVGYLLQIVDELVNSIRSFGWSTMLPIRPIWPIV